MDSVWDNQEFLEYAEKKRDSLRAKGKRLTFDCLNLKCNEDRAVCSYEIRLGQAKDKSLHITSVLKGITSSACTECGYYIEEDVNNV